MFSASRAESEPIFLAKQYARCATCHYSPTGGGLLTPYGRSISHTELSTFSNPTAASDDPAAIPTGEEAFLYGAIGRGLGPAQLGIELRPAHLTFSTGGIRTHRNFLMTADLIGAVRAGEWTIYGQVGRQAVADGGEIDSFEYWAGRLPERGLGFRVGRFLPAYGVKFADHTTFNRRYLTMAQFDQVYAIEVSETRDRSLLQVTVGPGLAESVLHDEGGGSFTMTGRFQRDVTTRTVVAASGLFRGESDRGPRTGAAGVAVGFAPGARATTWTEFDTVFEKNGGGNQYLLVHETAIEAFRGMWFKVSPQWRTGAGAGSVDLARLALEAVLLPRTHWNVNVSLYRDRFLTLDTTSTIFLAQLHLYL
jgi:hypothetical protein